MKNSRNNRVAHTCSAAICRSASASRAASTTASAASVGSEARNDAGGGGGTTRGGSSTGCDKAGSSGGGSSAAIDSFSSCGGGSCTIGGGGGGGCMLSIIVGGGCGMIMSCGMSSIRARCAIICASTAVMGAAPNEEPVSIGWVAVAMISANPLASHGADALSCACPSLLPASTMHARTHLSPYMHPIPISTPPPSARTRRACRQSMR